MICSLLVKPKFYTNISTYVIELNIRPNQFLSIIHNTKRKSIAKNENHKFKTNKQMLISSGKTRFDRRSV